MKLQVIQEDFNPDYPVALHDDGIVVARFVNEKDARAWASMRRYEIVEAK